MKELRPQREEEQIEFAFHKLNKDPTKFDPVKLERAIEPFRAYTAKEDYEASTVAHDVNDHFDSNIQHGGLFTEYTHVKPCKIIRFDLESEECIEHAPRFDQQPEDFMKICKTDEDHVLLFTSFHCTVLSGMLEELQVLKYESLLLDIIAIWCCEKLRFSAFSLNNCTFKLSCWIRYKENKCGSFLKKNNPPVNFESEFKSQRSDHFHELHTDSLYNSLLLLVNFNVDTM